jgi:hypothetical protein
LPTKIVPPTSQNQKAIENDLRRFVERHIEGRDFTPGGLSPEVHAAVDEVVRRVFGETIARA